jgi:hypothetical protein
MIMFKTPKYALPLFAFAVALATSSISMADAPRLPESGMGHQKGPTIEVQKNVPRMERTPTHTMGVVTSHNPNGPLKGPEMREMHESGMGRLVGGVKQGDPKTPKREPSATVTLTPQ